VNNSRSSGSATEWIPHALLCADQATGHLTGGGDRNLGMFADPQGFEATGFQFRCEHSGSEILRCVQRDVTEVHQTSFERDSMLYDRTASPIGS